VTPATPSAQTRILVAEDDPGMRGLLERILAQAGYAVTTAEDGQAALEAFRRERPALLVTDLKMPRLDGMALLRRVLAEAPGTPAVVLTAFGTVEGAVEAMRLGAFDYLSKPLPDPEHLRDVVARALAARGASPATEPRGPVYEDPAFARVMALVDAVAARDTTVLLTGESGVGKEVVARAVHDRGPRHGGPFVALNCAALPETLLESELFGHEKGAFTGATGPHPGLFEQAQGGSLLLDEVGEMQPALQAKFLRVLETRRVVRLGGTRERDVDTRVIAATNRDLDAEVAQGRFRQDLLFRLNVFPIHLPPLRERPGDILPLAHHFLRVLGTGPGRTPPSLSREARDALLAHQWPGNVRELMNALERATILASGGEIRLEHLGPTHPEKTAAASGATTSADGAASDASAPGAATSADGAAPSAAPAAAPAATLKEMERQAIIDALAAVDGNRRKAARRLGIALRTLQYKIKDYGIQ
jgi:two-component system response regulator FlrC